MKTNQLISLFIFLITITGCTKSSSPKDENEDEYGITPPEWIQATWLDANGSGYRFTQDDMIIITVVNGSTQEESLQQSAQQNNKVLSESIETSFVYEIKVEKQSDHTYVLWHFTKLSSSVIERIDNIGNRYVYNRVN